MWLSRCPWCETNTIQTIVAVFMSSVSLFYKIIVILPFSWLYIGWTLLSGGFLIEAMQIFFALWSENWCHWELPIYSFLGLKISYVSPPKNCWIQNYFLFLKKRLLPDHTNSSNFCFFCSTVQISLLVSLGWTVPLVNLILFTYFPTVPLSSASFPSPPTPAFLLLQTLFSTLWFYHNNCSP